MAEQKKVKANIKFRIGAGKATPAPPVGSLLGAQGIQTMEFINQFNEQTKDMGNVEVAVNVAIFEDRTFTFTVKGEPIARLIKRAAGVDKGAGNPLKDKVAKLTKNQVREIAEAKMADLNANDPEAAFKMVAGSARSMGITVEE
ncbi:MAG TPA: 50S ribosomal protein L11 [Candidatus Saccharimonadales bacterium]|nr:50S ribosomal protein L11 [Candidatus Saccharimonadales bacterium]